MCSSNANNMLCAVRAVSVLLVWAVRPSDSDSRATPRLSLLSRHFHQIETCSLDVLNICPRISVTFLSGAFGQVLAICRLADHPRIEAMKDDRSSLVSPSYSYVDSHVTPFSGVSSLWNSPCEWRICDCRHPHDLERIGIARTTGFLRESVKFPERCHQARCDVASQPTISVIVNENLP
jgi:hypothetical protein